MWQIRKLTQQIDMFDNVDVANFHGRLVYLFMWVTDMAN